jgi:hypothetical protein
MINQELKLIEWEEKLKLISEDELEATDKLLRKMLCRVIDERTYRLVGETR